MVQDPQAASSKDFAETPDCPSKNTIRDLYRDEHGPLTSSPHFKGTDDARRRHLEHIPSHPRCKAIWDDPNFGIVPSEPESNKKWIVPVVAGLIAVAAIVVIAIVSAS